jgi:hypothetical protein
LFQLTVENLFERPSDKEEQELAELKHKLFFSEFGDHIMLLAIYDTWTESGCSQAWCEENYMQVGYHDFFISELSLQLNAV